MRLADIFAKRNEPESVSDSIRALVREDLNRVITTSNRNLIKSFKLVPSSVKSEKQVERLVRNTESTMYKYNGDDLEKYLETQVVFLVFLTDPKLSVDFILFRFLLNVDLEDLYLEPD